MNERTPSLPWRRVKHHEIFAHVQGARNSDGVKRWRDLIQELAAAQKSAAGVSLWSRFVNRPLGRVLAATAIRLGVSANTVSVVSALFSVAAVTLLVAVPPTGWLGLVVAALFVLGFALDSADGQVARATHSSSPAGEWLDHVIDAGKMVAVHAAVLVGWYRFVDLPHRAWLALPLAYQLVAVILFAGGTLAPLVVANPASLRHPPSTVRAAALLPADFGVLSLSFVVWGAPVVFRAVYLALGIVTTLITASLCARWFRTLQPAREDAA